MSTQSMSTNPEWRELQFIPFHIQNHVFYALLDTGSTINLLNSRIQSTVKTQLNQSDSIDIEHIGGAITTLGSTDTEFAMGSFTVKSRFQVVDMSYDAIFGIPFLMQYQGVIDIFCQNIQLIINNQRLHFPISGVRNSKDDSSSQVLELVDYPTFLKHARNNEQYTCFVEWVRTDEHTGSPCHIHALTPTPSSDTPFDDIRQRTISHLMQSFPTTFVPKDTLPHSRGSLDHDIILIDQNLPPKKFGLRPMSPLERAEVVKKVRDALQKGILRPSSSPYGAPVCFSRKKDGSLRMCIDYRTLNQNTILNSYPIPRTDQLIESLGGMNVFSKIDLSDAFLQLRMVEGKEYLTAFKTHLGLFEWLVMPFGLTNGPASFQSFMNHVLQDLIGSCCYVYMDDIIVFSPTAETHVEHLYLVFSALYKFDVRTKPTKCQFFSATLEFLGINISCQGLSVSDEKIRTVQQWPTPTCIRDVQQFLGLVNFSRKFIRDFATLALPLYKILKVKNKKDFVWSQECQQAFDLLKQALTSHPVLLLPDYTRPFELHTDASDFAVGAALMQYPSGSDAPRPVAYFSRKLNNAEQNYSVHERELLAVVAAAREWRHHLEGCQFVVKTDHAPLRHILTQPQLSRRQARWLEFLGQFKFTVEYVRGIDNKLPDALSRRVDYSNSINLVNLQPSTQLIDVIKAAYREDDPEYAQFLKLALSDSDEFSVHEGLLMYHHTHIYVPKCDLRRQLIYEYHTTIFAGHFGIEKTAQRLQQYFYWPGLYTWVKKYITDCPVCQRVKSGKARGELQPLPIPNKPFESVSLDFITHLPKSTSREFDTVLVVVCRLSKMVRLIPCFKSSTAPEVADLFYFEIVRNFGLPCSIISDRDVRFVSKFWRSLFDLMGTQLCFSSSYHPESDGQTERVNRTLQQVLRCTCGDFPDTWATPRVIASVEIALNSAQQSSIKLCPFEVCLNFVPAMPLDVAIKQSSIQGVNDYCKDRADVIQAARAHMNSAQLRYKRNYDKHRLANVQFQVGDKVWVARAAIPSLRNKEGDQGKRLDWPFIGPCKVLKVISQLAYQIQLPPSLVNVHNVFHVSKLKGVMGNQPFRVSMDPVTTDSGDQEYLVEAILNHELYRVTRRSKQPNRVKRFLVKFCGQGSEYNEWLPCLNLANAKDLVRAYCKRHSLVVPCLDIN